MSRSIVKKLVTPNGDTMVDEVNDALRVNMVVGSITLSGADGAILDGVDPAIKATVKDYTNSNPMAVILMDTNGSPAGSAGGMSDAEFTAHLPLPVSDNAGSLTVDGTVAATQSGAWILSANSGVDIGDVTINNASLNVTDNASSLTVDAPVGTPVFVRLSDGAAAIAALPVTDNAGSLTVDGTVAVSSLPALVAGAANIGDVDVLTLPALTAGTNRIGSVRLVDSADADLTSVVSTQTSRAVGVQELHDAGRTAVNFYAVAAAAGTTGTETMITLTRSAGTAATSTGTSFVLTNAKRLRITGISVATRGHATATIQTTTFNLRLNTAGAVIATSTPVIFAARSATPATASAWDRFYCSFEEGYEILGNGTIQMGISAAATYVTNAPTWDVNIVGYEY